MLLFAGRSIQTSPCWTTEGCPGGDAPIETRSEAKFGMSNFMTDNAKRTDNCPATPVSAPTRVTETDLRDFAVTHVLPNGASIKIRAVRPDDKEHLRAAFGKLDRTSIYTRFFGHRKELTETELEQAINVDFDRVVALWATIDSGGAEIIIGGGRYLRNAEPASLLGAEVAFAVEEDYHGQGIASCLLSHLVRIARNKGLLQFEADVLAANRPMLAVFARSGLPMQQQRARDVIHVTLSLHAGQS